MNEFELKLVFPQERLVGIENLIVSKGGLRRQKLQAYYFDTDRFSLAHAGISLRLRKEGRSWIQTLKAKTSSQFERHEHNVVLNHTGVNPPSLDIQLHQEHAAYKVLLKALRADKQNSQNLALKYQTNVWRRIASVRARGAMLEYALDVGEIKAFQLGGHEKIIPIREIEIELKSGDKAAVINHGKILVNRFGAYIDTRSKAQQGFNAANGFSSGPPVRAKSITLKSQSDSHIASSLLNSCLNQILPNVSEINSNLDSFDEHIHQLRVGLRRLKSTMKILGLIQIYLSESDVNQLSFIFGKLGQYRDYHFIDEKLKPIFLSINAPPMNFSSVSDLPDPAILLRSKEFQLFCLSIIELSLSQEKLSPSVKRLKPLLIQDLNRVHKDTKKLATIFMDITEERRHKLRKRLKHLRYTLEFFADFCNKSDYKNYLTSLARVLDSLGHYNDICVAIEKSQDRLINDKNILFAMGWLKSEQARSCQECANAVTRFSLIKKIW